MTTDTTDTDTTDATRTAALRTHLAVVDRAVRLTPRVRRITFAGDDLADYRPLAPDQFLYLLLPPPGRTELTVGRDFDWISYHQMPEDERPVGSHYTVRHHRPERGEIDVDFVLHEGPGPAGAWAERARPGDPVALWGPRTTYRPPHRVDWYLLVADETGLPATAAILEHLAGRFDGPVHVVAEVADAREQQPLATMPGQAEQPVLSGLRVTWRHRGSAAAGTTTGLFDTVCGLDLPDGAPYIWGGGESRTMTQIRKHVRHQLGLPRERVSLTPYWRHTLHADDPDDEAEDDDDS
jgi:NADPH-dependent ferric siderophore reductase